MKYVFNVDMIEAGMVVSENVTDPKSGVVLIANGTPLTSSYINSLKRRDITEVTVELSPKQKKIYEMDHNVIPTVDTKTMKQAAEIIKGLKSNSDFNEMTIKQAIESAKKISNQVLQDSKLSYRLSDYKMNKESSEHAARVAVYATAVANKYNERFNDKVDGQKYKINLENIATAALMHDIGKLCKNNKTRNELTNLVYLGSKFPGLSRDKMKELKQKFDKNFIPYYGFNLIQGNHLLPSEVKAMILLSGEDEAGDGPLKAIQAMEIRSAKEKHVVGAKIINFCSMYDEFLIDNIREEVTLENAYSAMQGLLANRKFSDDLFDDFIQTVPLYPEGTKVILQGDKNGYAVVGRNFGDRTNYSRPILITVPNNEFVDLRKSIQTTIKHIVGDEVKMSKLYLEKIVEEDWKKNHDDEIER